jgi:ubiquinone/menaquinone biosynthesis C-methylase UbiE
MSVILKVVDNIMPAKSKRVSKFDIEKGMTIIDYGCGPGLYIPTLSNAAGNQGRVIAIDLNRNAEKEVNKIVQKYNLQNVTFKLADGYNSNIESNIADRVIALDMFFMVEKPTEFLKELYRICKDDGLLIIDDGHQSRAKSKQKIADSGVWQIVEESKDFMICKKVA